MANPVIRPCRDTDLTAMHIIINEAAERYRGVIPHDCWHEPYMTRAALEADIRAGVAFSCCAVDDVLIGVMGIQSVMDVDLIRHAYVSPTHQGTGVGSALLEHLERQTTRPILIGTWAAATWAINFYRRKGFGLAGHETAQSLLRRYWSISDRQAETSVVLAKPPV